MSHQEYRVPIARLTAAIEELLEEGPCIVDEIAHALRYSGAAVRLRLNQLMKAGRVHRRRIGCANNPGLFYRWHIGQANNDVGQDTGENFSDLPPIQLTVQTYPAVNRRDPLVAALFGK